MKRRIVLWSVLAAFIIAAYSIFTNQSEPLSDEFGGSYSCDDAIYSIVMSIDVQGGNFFYYTDSKNNCYIKGSFEEKDNNVYSISCDNAMNKEIIPDQNIIQSNRSFTLTVNSRQRIFKKVHQVPILYCDENIYK